jgi:competence protein ComEC
MRSGPLASRAAIWALVLALAVAPLAACQQPASSRKPEPALHIRQLDVGQGDAALITTPEGRRILIDAGPNPNAVAALLRRDGIDTLDLVIASHSHADHIGGLPMIFASFVVRAYVDNGIPNTTSIYRRVLTAVEREPGVRYLRATDRTISVGSSVKLHILPLPLLDSSQNNNSVGVLVEYGRFSALYTGDSEHEELGTWLRDKRVPHVSFVKVAHHGSGNGTTAALVRATSPEVVVISVGSPNGYGHPSPNALKQWSKATTRVYRTDRDGEVDVSATADGRLSVHTRGAGVAQLR